MVARKFWSFDRVIASDGRPRRNQVASVWVRVSRRAATSRARVRIGPGGVWEAHAAAFGINQIFGDEDRQGS